MRYGKGLHPVLSFHDSTADRPVLPVLPTLQSQQALRSVPHQTDKTRRWIFNSGSVLSFPTTGCDDPLIAVLDGALKVKRQYKAGLFLSHLLGPGDFFRWRETAAPVILVAAARTVVGCPPSVRVGSDSSAPSSDVSRSQYCELQTRRLRRPLSLMPVRARVAATLSILAVRFGRKSISTGGLRTTILDLDLTREELAHLAGTVYESVIRNLLRLKEEGIILVSGRRIEIIGEDQLARIGQVVVES